MYVVGHIYPPQKCNWLHDPNFLFIFHKLINLWWELHLWLLAQTQIFTAFYTHTHTAIVIYIQLSFTPLCPFRQPHKMCLSHFVNLRFLLIILMLHQLNNFFSYQSLRFKNNFRYTVFSTNQIKQWLFLFPFF